MRYTDEQRIQRITTLCEKLTAYLQDNHLGPDDVMRQEYTQWAITTPLYNIGENVYHLSDEYKKARPDIPWLMISGLRHRLVHDYESTNWTIICKVLFEELPLLLEKLKA